MAFFRKLMFWKKDDLDLSNLGALGAEPRASLGQMPGEMPADTGRPQFSYPNAPELVPPAESFPRHGMAGMGASMGYSGSDSSFILAKDIEILSSKLDALRAGIESINQRLANLERMAGADNQQRKYQW
ncbi:MAG TPA: hypothetical protein VJB08_05095 [Candidatus Nanoarchaeia archaeon]|nr:hypothetical protein [Candidatus Nanoarchaeia archaeon]